MLNQQINNDVRRTEAAILKVLSNSSQPLGGRVLARRLGDLGIDLGERTVRYHLKLMDERGLTCTAGRKDGRLITESGIEELNGTLVADRIGLVATRIDTLIYQGSFDFRKRMGEVPVNISLFSQDDFGRAMEIMRDVFLSGFGLGDLIYTAQGGDEPVNMGIPPDKVGLATVSHIVIFGVLLRAGIHIEPKFGGILQIKGREALRFVDLIEYAGCSLEPSEVFITSNMTSVKQAAGEGNGKILASFCEIPAVARHKAESVIKELETIGIRGLIKLGKAGESVFQFPVAANRIGVVLTDGLNPVAAAVETGMEVTNHAMHSLTEFEKLYRFSDYRKWGVEGATPTADSAGK